MIDATKSGEGRLHGAWSHLTIDALLDSAVKSRPLRPSFHDAVDIASWSDLAGKSVTFDELGAMVTRFARQVTALGLRRGDHVLVAMPNCVDGIVALIGLMAAGMVPCPVAVVADRSEMRFAAEAVDAKAIVTVNRYAEYRPSDEARQAAFSHYGIRFICAFGPTPPEGVVCLDDWTDAELSADELPISHQSTPALVTFDRTDAAMTPHVRTHAQIVGDALALSAISGLTGRGSIIATFAPVSAAGFISTIAAPLISGAMVYLHGPFDSDVLRRQIERAPEAIMVMPASVEEAVRRVTWPAICDTVVVTRDLAAPRSRSAPGRVTELVSLGEAALWSLLRDNTRVRSRLPRFHPHPVGTALPRTMALVEISVSNRGRLALSGFGVAPPLAAAGAAGRERGPVETRWQGHADGPEHFTLLPEEGPQTDESSQFRVAAA